MANENKVIKEIVCLKNTDMATGRPRVLKPGDFEDGLHWERIVDVALEHPSDYEIHRETVYSEDEENEDLSKIDIKEMLGLSRERVAEIGVKVYGIKAEGQSRSTYIDQIADEKAKEEQMLANHAGDGVVDKPKAPASEVIETK